MDRALRKRLLTNSCPVITNRIQHEEREVKTINAGFYDSFLQDLLSSARKEKQNGKDGALEPKILGNGMGNETAR